MSNTTDWSEIDRSGLRVAATFGRFFLGPLYLWLTWSGRLKIVGRENLVETVKRGPTAILTKHVSILDSFLVAMIFYPLYFTSSRYFLWSMPDENFFRRFLKLRVKWIPRVLRCIRVERKGGREAVMRNRSAMDFLAQVYLHGYSGILHPEGGRTATGEDVQRIVHNRQERTIRNKLQASVVHVAAEYEIPIITGYIHAPALEGKLGFGTCIWRLLCPWREPVVISFEQPAYIIEKPYDILWELSRLKTFILTS